MARTLYFDVNHHNKKDGLVLGHKYDHKDTIIHFKGFYAADPSNTIYFKLQTDNGNWMIPLADYEWLVTQPMTLHDGEFRGQLEERAADNSLVHNSDTFKVTVLKSIQEGEEYEVIDPTLDLWAVQLSNLYNELVTARDAGEFDGADGAPGEDGFSPTVSITNITGGKRITIVDKNGSHSADIMNGIDGQPGEDGEDGISPTVSISKTGKVTTISITDADGTHTATVNDGNDGSDASVTVQNIVAALGYTPADAQGLANTDEHIAEDIEPAISSMSMEIGNLPTDVKINGTSILDDDKVANIPVASTNLGLVKILGGNGLYVDSNGRLYVDPASTANINGRTNGFKPIVSTNLVKAVDSVLCSTASSEALTETQQSNARARLGLEKKFELIEEITLTEETQTISRNAEPNGTAYNFKSIIVQVTYSNNTVAIENPMLSLVYNDNSVVNWVTALGTQPIVSTVKNIMHTCNIIGGRAFAESSITQGAIQNQGSIYRNVYGSGIMEKNTIDAITVSSYRGTYPVGTKITIYAVRA